MQLKLGIRSSKYILFSSFYQNKCVWLLYCAIIAGNISPISTYCEFLNSFHNTGFKCMSTGRIQRNQEALRRHTCWVVIQRGEENSPRDLPSSQLIVSQGYKSRSLGKLSQERRRLSHRKELLDWKLGFCCQTPAENELELNAKINLHQEASQKKPGLIISTCVSGNTQSLSPSLQGPINSLNKTAWLLDCSKQDSQSCQTSIEKFLLSLYVVIVT